MENLAKAKPQNNPRFMQPVLPAFLTSFSIPLSFKERLEEEGYETEKVVLVNEVDSRYRDFDNEWEIKVEGGIHFRQGWKDFCEDHNLRLGDFLVFTHLGNLVFHVSVFNTLTGVIACQRPSHKGTSKHSSTHKRKSAEVEAATPEIPFVKLPLLCCDATITPYAYERGDVNLTMSFVRSHHLLRRRCQIELIDEKGKSWEAKLNYRTARGQPYVARGLKDFLVEKNLKPGDTIRFEFLKKGKRPTMKCYRTFNSSSSSTHRRKRVDVEVATSVRPSVISKYPSFDFTITVNSLKRPVIYIPMSFVRSNDLFKRRCQMELIDGKGKSWQANLHCRKSTSQSYIIAQGWKGFLVRNSLKPGNLIRFELLDNREKPIMKCYRLTGRKMQDHSG